MKGRASSGEVLIGVNIGQPSRSLEYFINGPKLSLVLFHEDVLYYLSSLIHCLLQSYHALFRRVVP